MVALPDQSTKESAIHSLRGSAMPSVSRHFTRTYVIFERNCYDLGECFVSKKVRLITIYTEGLRAHPSILIFLFRDEAYTLHLLPCVIAYTGSSGRMKSSDVTYTMRGRVIHVEAARKGVQE